MNLVNEKKCDFCGATPEKIIDGRTVAGWWAWMCESCWEKHKMYNTFGKGKGQMFTNKKGGEKLEG